MINKFANKLDIEKGEEGFSLIELVIVVAVLAILSAIAIPSFQSLTRKARQISAASHVDAILKSATIFRVEEGYFPTSWSEILVYYKEGSAGSNLESCEVYNSQCNGNEKVIVNGQYLITFFNQSDRFGVSAWRFNNTGGTSTNLSVMGCATSTNGGRNYLFKDSNPYYQGAPWNSGILDENGDELDLCG